MSLIPKMKIMNIDRYSALNSKFSGGRSAREKILVLVSVIAMIGAVSCTSTKLKTPDQLAGAQTLLVLPVNESNEAHLKKHGFYYIYEIVNIDSFYITHRAVFRLPIKEDMLIVDSLPPGNYAVRQFEFKTVGSGNFTYGNNLEPRDDQFRLEPGKITIFHQSLNVRLYNRIPGRGMTTHYQFGMEPLDPNQRNEIVARLGALQYLNQWNISNAPYRSAVSPKKASRALPERELTGTYVSENTGTDRSKFLSNYSGGKVRLMQAGNEITGTYGDAGKISGVMDGNTIRFDWWGIPRQGTGVGIWEVLDGGTELRGTWISSGRHYSGTWNLKKIE